MKCCDVKTNSLKHYHRECMKNSVEKMHHAGAKGLMYNYNKHAEFLIFFLIFYALVMGVWKSRNPESGTGAGNGNGTRTRTRTRTRT